MITKENLQSVIDQLTPRTKNRIKNSAKEYTVLQLSIFNTGSKTTATLTDDYNRYKNVSHFGNCILETQEVKKML